MGQLVSFDAKPLPYASLTRSLSSSSSGSGSSNNNSSSSADGNNTTPQAPYRHNIKIYRITQDNEIREVSIFSPQQQQQQQDETVFGEDECYIVLHFYCVDESETTSAVEKISNKTDASVAVAAATQDTDSVSKTTRHSSRSFFDFLCNHLGVNLQAKSLSHPFSIPSQYHTLHLYNGKNSSSQTQAFAISQCLHLERLFMDLKRRHFVSMMTTGEPRLIGSQANEREPCWIMDIPLLSKVPKSIASSYMHLYSSCDLFRVVVNDCTHVLDNEERQRGQKREALTNLSKSKHRDSAADKTSADSKWAAMSSTLSLSPSMMPSSARSPSSPLSPKSLKSRRARLRDLSSKQHAHSSSSIHDMWLRGLSMHEILHLPPVPENQQDSSTEASSTNVRQRGQRRTTTPLFKSRSHSIIRNENNDWIPSSAVDGDSPRKAVPPVPISRLNLRSLSNSKSARSTSSASSSPRTNHSSSASNSQRHQDGSHSGRIPLLNNLMVNNQGEPFSGRTASSGGFNSGRSQLTASDMYTTDDDFTASTVSTARSSNSARQRSNQLIGNVRPRPDDLHLDLERAHISKSARSSRSDQSPHSSRSSSSYKNLDRQMLLPKMGKFSLDLDSVMASSSLDHRRGDVSARSNASSDSTGDLIPNPSMSGAELVMHFRKKVSNVHNGFLFVGSDRVAKNKEKLKKCGITHIINAAKLACDVYFPDDFEYLVLSLYDSGTESILGIFFQVIEFIERAREQGGKVLVHCYEGVSRSTTLAIAYIMWKTRKGFNHVMEEVKRKRGSASPNAGFIVQLLQWEKMLKDPQRINLYRISPLNDRFFEHQQLVPHLCNANVLDSRTCFVLLDSKTNKIFVWEGRNSIEKMRPQAEEFARRLKSYFGNQNTEVVCFLESEADQYPDFLRAIKNVSIIGAPRKRNKEEVYPELEYLDVEGCMEDAALENASQMNPNGNNPDQRGSEPLDGGFLDMDDGDGGLYDSPAELYEYPTWEVIDNFDSDDLYDDAVFVLKPLDKDGTLYVWIGRSVPTPDEEESLDSFGQTVAKCFIEEKEDEKQYEKIIVVEDGDEEGTGMWDYFSF